MSGSATFEIPADIWEFSIEDGAVLARPDFQGLFLLNQSASALWYLFRQRLPPDEIIRAYSDLYSISASQAESDVRVTVEAWRELFNKVGPSSTFGVLQKREQADFAFVGDYRIQSADVRLRIGDEDLVEEIAPRLEPLAIPAQREKPAHCFEVARREGLIGLFYNGRELAREENPAAARAILLQEMVRVCEPGRDWLAVLHAGACGTDTDCVLFAGSTHSGKTTLAAALMYSGLRLYCDDSAAIDSQTFEVPAMPFALMLREGSWPPLQSRYPEIERLPILMRYGQKVRFLSPDRNRWPASQARVRALLFTRYEPGAKASLTGIGPFEVLVRLRESGFWVAHTAPQIARFLKWIQTITAYTLVYSDLNDAVSKVRLAGQL